MTLGAGCGLGIAQRRRISESDFCTTIFLFGKLTSLAVSEVGDEECGCRVDRGDAAGGVKIDAAMGGSSPAPLVLISDATCAFGRIT
jgi:hypothetical protein